MTIYSKLFARHAALNRQHVTVEDKALKVGLQISTSKAKFLTNIIERPVHIIVLAKGGNIQPVDDFWYARTLVLR